MRGTSHRGSAAARAAPAAAARRAAPSAGAWPTGRAPPSVESAQGSTAEAAEAAAEAAPEVAAVAIASAAAAAGAVDAEVETTVAVDAEVDAEVDAAAAFMRPAGAPAAVEAHRLTRAIRCLSPAWTLLAPARCRHLNRHLTLATRWLGDLPQPSSSRTHR
eukprot:scaffold3951_cov58-Phaeocystis_antarctica.AAC.3